MLTTLLTRAKIGIIAVVILCLLSTVRFVLRPPGVDAALGRQITVTENEKRFEEIKKVLPARGVGYLGGDSNHQYELPNYYLTQYALAPLVVDHSLEHHFVIGNFPSPTLPPAEILPGGLKLIRDFGNGVVLFEKRAK